MASATLFMSLGGTSIEPVCPSCGNSTLTHVINGDRYKVYICSVCGTFTWPMSVVVPTEDYMNQPKCDGKAEITPSEKN